MPEVLPIPNEPALTNIHKAYSALQRGDKLTARRIALELLSSPPYSEEPWLILAAAASPRASIYYLQRALEINPESIPACNGLEWAQKRLVPLAAPRVENAARPARPSNPGKRWLIFSIVAVALVILGTAIGYASFRQAALPALVLNWFVPAQAERITSMPKEALAAASSTSTQPVTITPKPTFTPSPTSLPTKAPTPVDSATPLPSPTTLPTSTPLPTATSLPSPTAKPTLPPAPAAKPQNSSSTVYIVQPGDSLVQIAAQFGITVQDILAANTIANPSRINAGQKITLPVAGSSSGSAGPGVPPAAPGNAKSIIVDISEQRLYAYEGSNLVYNFIVSTGSGNGTLTGSFTILDKESNAWSYPWGFWMPDWMGIYWVGYDLENGIHSLPVLSNGQTIWGDELGSPVSYGCVVLSPTDADKLFAWAVVGTSVLIRP